MKIEGLQWVKVPGAKGVDVMVSRGADGDTTEVRAAFRFYAVESIKSAEPTEADLAAAVDRAVRSLLRGVRKAVKP